MQLLATVKKNFKTPRDGTLQHTVSVRVGACLLTSFRRASDARQMLPDPEESAVEPERAGFREAPEKAEMAAAPFCKHL